MVHRMDSLDESTAPEKSSLKTAIVKTEFDELIDDGHGPLLKRPKLDFSHEENNPLDEPSPLGLKLKKSPSFLDLIQMRLSQEKSASLAKTLPKKEKGTGPTDKLKASNFPASLLNIGTWEYKSRYEGDLVAKCYFAKHKLVWEVLDGGLKNKIEIQWSDIMAIKAHYPDDAPGTLNVVLARQPLFFREINPQPRKHTLWQATSDFTCGQATIHRQHFLQFPQGTLGKHFEKLMQCDPRLRFLSQQPEMVLDSPYFQSTVSNLGDHSDYDHGFELTTERISSFSGYRSTISTSGLSSDIHNQDQRSTPTEHSSQGNPPAIAGMFVTEGSSNGKVNETDGLSLLNQIKLPGLHPSMSVGDLVNHIGDCISEKMRSDNPSVSINESQKRSILDEITQYLLSDCPTTPISDEKHIMSRVNSLCCLLQQEPTTVQNPQNDLDLAVGDTRERFDLVNGSCENRVAEKLRVSEGEMSPGNGYKQGLTRTMSRKESFGELLLHLPRIASLPQFLIDVPKESGDHGR